jgi:N-acetylmuramic acid 6-phosphate etherase
MNLDLANLLTEQQNPRSAAIDRVSTLEALMVINDEDQQVPVIVRGVLSAVASAVDQIAARVSSGGRLFYQGAGTSGRLGVLDAAECPPTFGVPPDLVQGVIAGGDAALARATEASEDSEELGAYDLKARGLQARDSLVGIAASGRTPYVIGGLRYARELGVLTVALACAEDSVAGRIADLAIEVPVGPEVLTGSTRLKAGTATKLVLNMISTALMIRLGYTFGNLMVNVQPKNDKLRDRARRIIASAAGVSAEVAGDFLREAGDDVKTAIVMARLGVDPARARERLVNTRGVLSEAIDG